MKKRRTVILLVAFATVLSAQSINAEPNYSAIKTSNAQSNLYLQQALELVSKQFGVHFEVDVDISAEKVIMPAMNDGTSAIKALLKNYNWVSVQDRKDLIKVIICSKVSDYSEASNFTPENNIVIRDKLNNWQSAEYVGTR